MESFENQNTAECFLIKVMSFTLLHQKKKKSNNSEVLIQCPDVTKHFNNDFVSSPPLKGLLKNLSYSSSPFFLPPPPNLRLLKKGKKS